jgi:hypothetical protein
LTVNGTRGVIGSGCWLRLIGLRKGRKALRDPPPTNTVVLG